MNGWENRWMDLAKLVATWSKDRSRQVGCVIVDDRQAVVALGWNGFPRGVDDLVDMRHVRPAKYMWTEHAERNAVYNAAAQGQQVRGCVMHVTLFPCADCARAAVQAGIKKIICPKPQDDSKWSEHFKVAEEMLHEAQIQISFVGTEQI